MYNVYNIELLIHVLNETTAGKRYTAEITGRYVPIPATGTVSAGTGTVWGNRTRSIPVRNPKERARARARTHMHTHTHMHPHLSSNAAEVPR